MNDTLKSSQHRKRILTAVIAVSVAGSIYYAWGHAAVILLTGLIVIAASYELLNLLLDANQARSQRWWKTGFGVLLSAVFFASLNSAWTLAPIYAAFLAIFGQTVFFSHRDNQLERHLRDGFAQFFTLFYIGGFLLFVPGVHALPHGTIWFILLLVSVWCGDIAAYYGGKFFGRHKLSINLSPGKTWEGAFSSLVFVTGLAAVIAMQLLPHLPTWKPALIVALASIAGQIGDLLESLIKRVAAVKDSGNLFPGHGGAFDRFDSLILAAPLFYLLVRVLT